MTDLCVSDHVAMKRPNWNNLLFSEIKVGRLEQENQVLRGARGGTEHEVLLSQMLQEAEAAKAKYEDEARKAQARIAVLEREAVASNARQAAIESKATESDIAIKKFSEASRELTELRAQAAISDQEMDSALRKLKATEEALLQAQQLVVDLKASSLSSSDADEIARMRSSCF